MLATTTPQSPGRPAPPPSSSPGTSKSKSAMKPSTSSGSSASTTTTPGDSLPPLPVSPRQQRHSTAAVGSANANSSPRHGTRSGPHSRRASFSTATDSVPGSPSQPSSGMATGTGTATGTDAVQFLKDRTSQRKSSTSASGSSTPLAAHGSPTSAPPSAGSNGRKHRPAALQLGNHSTFASSSSSSFDHPAPPLVSPSLRTAPLASTASPATHASSASTPSSASTTNTTTPASSRPTSSGHPHPHHHAQHTGPAPLKYTHPADALLPPNPNDGITRYTRSTLFSIRDALPTPIPVPAFLTIKDPSPTDPASLGITINNVHIPTGGLSALASPTSPSFASGSARRRGSTFGGFTSAPGSATGSSFHIPNAPSISGGRHSRAPTGATQPQVDPAASTEVLESSMRSLHEALEKLHKDPAATGKTKATEPAPVKQHKLRSAVVETDEKVVPASSSSKLACDLLAADARLSPTHSSSDDVSSETTVKNAPINSPRRPAYELEEGEIPVSPPGGSTVHLHDMASQTLASPPKNLLSPGSSSDGPHSPSLLAAQLLHMVDSDEQVNQGPPTTSVPQQPQAQTASQDFRNHPARAYQHQRGSPMTSSPSNVPAGALTLPPEPPGPPIPVPASANAAATGATSRYRQGSGPTSSTPSISGWRGPTARDTGTSRSRHSTSSAAPSPATSLINSQPWATASSSSTGSPAASPAHNPLAGYESLLPEHLLQQAKESLGDGAPPPARASASNVRSSARTALPGSSAAAAKQASSAAAVELPPALRGKLATLDTVQPSDPVKLEENLEALSKLAPFGGIGAPPARSGAYASTSAAAVMQGQTMGLIAKSHPVPPAVLLGTSPPPPPQGAGATTMPRARNATHPVVDLHGGVRGEPYKSGSTVGPSPPLPPVESQRAGTPPTAGASSSFLERLNARRAATATATARVPSPPSALMTGASADQAPPGPLSTRSLTSGFEGAGNRRESPPSVAQPGSAGPFASTFGSAVAARQSPGAESRGNSLDVQPGSVGAMEQWWMSGNQSERPQQSVQMDQQRHRYMTSPAAPTHSQDSNTTVMSPPTPFAPTHHLPPPSPLYTAAWDHQQQQQHQGPPHHSYSHAQQQMQPRLRRTSGAPPMHPHQVQHMFHQQHQHAYGGGGPHDQMYAPYHPHHPHHLPPPPGHPHAHPQHQLAQHAMAMSGSGAGIPGMSPGMPDLMVPDLKRAVESYLRDGQEALLSEYLHFLSYCHPAAAVKPYIKSLLTIGIKLKARERLVAAVYFGMKHGHYSVREVMETLATLDLGVMDLVQGGVAIMMIGFLLACMLKDSVVSPVEMEWLGKQFCAADLVSGQRLAGTLVANLFDIMSQPEFIAVMGLLNLHDLFGEQSAGKIAFQLARYLDVGVVQNVLKSSSAGGSTSAGAGGGNGGGGASPAAAPNAAPSIAA